jgi:integrase
MAEINATANTVVNPDSMTVAEFFDARYLPHCEEFVQSKKPPGPRQRSSTIRGHKQIWTQHLEGHFGLLTLQEYEAVLGTRFLKTLVNTQGKTTIKNVRSLGSSIFKLAVSGELIKANPWRDVQMPEDAEESNDTEHYTLSEIKEMISALVDHIDAQLVIALACFMALRPGEIPAVSWPDIDSHWLHVRQNVVRGIVGRPKTRKSIAKAADCGSRTRTSRAMAAENGSM